MRSLLLIGLGACAATPHGAADEPATVMFDDKLLPIELPAMRESDPAPSVGAYEVRELPVDKRMIHAVHSVASSVASTDDGGAAATVDAFGGVKLWPTLDGTREPVIVSLERPVAIELTRDGGQLVVVGLDQAGGFEIVRASAIGEPLSRRRVTAPRPIEKLRALSWGILALRDDQRLELFDLDGARRAVLAPEPGERIQAIIARRDRALAMIATQDSARARWIETGAAGLAWGVTSAPLRIDPTTAVLSPDLRHIAAQTRAQRAVIVDLASGRAATVPNAPDFQVEGNEVMRPLGFITTSTLVLDGVFGGTLWWNGEETFRTFAIESEGALSAVIADRRAIVATPSSLTVMTPQRKQVLSYELVNPVIVQPTARGGWLVAGWGGQNMVRVDARLRQLRTYAPNEHDPTHAMIALTDRYVAGIIGAAKQQTLVRYNLDDPDDVQTVGPALGYYLRYEPSTHLLAFDEAGTSVFTRFDPKTGKFGEMIRSDLSQLPYAAATFVTDPRLANGVVAIAEKISADGLEIEIVEIRAVCERCDDHLQLGRTYTIQRAEVDKVLQRYGLREDGTPDYAVSPDRSLVARLRDQRISLRTSAGAELWTIPAQGIASLAWSATGELVGIGNGIAQLDRATGDVTSAQCGWRFGLRDQQPSDRSVMLSICDRP